ncbi:MAG: hypothetical protein COT43_03675 [Candidatus Marinimicrobia bacterium CG08_land_8_20_14_0_20_45_22]|nr:MAG: hypothetical protein COT43_03675 [Candidatus Marinimicrobia bacterium CG08_land_8_20_14_0_20_45_22]
MAGFFYNFLGFPQNNSTESAYQEKFISVASGYGDTYRKKIDSKTTLTLAEQGNEIRFGLPFRTGKIRHILAGELTENFTYFNNLKDETSLASRFRIENTRLNTRWIISRGDRILGLGTEYGQINTSPTIDIISFPQSEDSRTNKYFFDLLEPTFGRELNNTLSLEKTGFSVWLATRLNRHWRIGAALNYADFSADWQIRYVNSSPYDSLSGKRRIDIPLDGFARIYKFSLSSLRPGLQELSLICYTDKYSYFIDNNRPSKVDKSSLGKGNLSRSGVALINRIKRQTWEFTSGLSVANYNLSASLNTPVVGYYLIFVPISHSAEINLSQGKSFSQQIGFDHSFQMRYVQIKAGAVYTHTLFDFQIDGISNMMCGVVSKDINYPFKYSLHILDLHAETEFHLGPLGLTYAFRQLIPTGKRLDDSPIHLTTQTPGVKYANRGGQEHQINLVYHF